MDDEIGKIVIAAALVLILLQVIILEQVNGPPIVESSIYWTGGEEFWDSFAYSAGHF